MSSKLLVDSLLGIVENSQKALAKAHDRLVSGFLRLRDVAVNPGLFFQNLIEADPKLVITYDLLCYYATLFDWNSSLNFRSVIQRHTTVAAWLESNNVPLSVKEPMPTPVVQEGGPGLSSDKKLSSDTAADEDELEEDE